MQNFSTTPVGPLKLGSGVYGGVLRAFAAVVLFSAASAALADFSGKVVGIIDGDTLDVLVDNRPVRVRLAQIDAPERKQAFGERARQALSDAAFSKIVTVVEAGTDRYGRVLGTVFAGGAGSGLINVNNQMIGEGMAWAYRQYVTDRSLFELENKARSSRLGLWADPAPVEPWLFRRDERTSRTN